MLSIHDIDFLGEEFISIFGSYSKHFAKISEVEFNILFATASWNFFWLSFDYNLSINPLIKSANSFENLSIIWSISGNSESLVFASWAKLGELSIYWINSFLGGLYENLLASLAIFKSLELREDADIFLLSRNDASPFTFSIDFSAN